MFTGPGVARVRVMFIVASVVAGAFVSSAGCGSGTTGVFAEGGVEGGSSGDAADGSTNVDGAGPGGGCTASAQCKPGFDLCRAPDEQVCGGPEALRECETNAECSDGGGGAPMKVCADLPCGQRACVAKCTTDAACMSSPPGLSRCNVSTGLCEARPCTGDNECPTNFVCSPGAARSCIRKSCTSAAECQGACVNGACWSGTGTCEPLPA